MDTTRRQLIAGSVAALALPAAAGAALRYGDPRVEAIREWRRSTAAS